MLAKRLIKSNDAGGGACTNTVDLYNPFPDGGGVALYQLNGDATDESGNYDGNFVNPAYGTGQFGQAGVFNGTSSFIDTNAKIPASLNFSVSFWMKSSDTSSGGYIFGTKGNYLTNGWLITNDAGYIRYGEGNGVDNATFQTSPSIVADGNWNHVVVTRAAGGTVNMYVNNSRVITNGSVGTYFMTSSTWANDLHIGRYSGSSILFYDGELDQVRIFSRALRPYEVEALYTEEYCTPTIVPSDHFNTVTWTSTGGNTNISITNVGFQPDLVWAKATTDAYSHTLYDSVRGAGSSHWLSSNVTNSESSLAASAAQYGYLGSFDLDGFTGNAGTSDNSYFNYSTGKDYVAWNFKAGGAAVTNTDGTITSQVSANTEAGFSIVTGSVPSSGFTNTYGHGLNETPKIVISKVKNDASDWFVSNNFLANNCLKLNTTAAAFSDSAFAQTSTTIKTAYTTSAYDFVAYCFAEVEGFSNFGSYVGNGTIKTVVTGFEPAFLMTKRTDAAGTDWHIWDNKRNPSNPLTLPLFPNEAYAETDYSAYPHNFLENGFSVNTSNGAFNANGATYIYMAFAADPTTIEPSLEDSFNTVLYTGDGTSSNEITGVGFQPDLIWGKQRNGSLQPHVLVDSVRGRERGLSSNNTNAEINYDGYNPPVFLSSFDDNGFTLGYGTGLNQSGINMVAWCWKGAELPAINSNGSIPSVVSANPAAGFSIVSFTGNGSAGSVGHGLGQEPKIIILKNRDGTNSWVVRSSDLGNGYLLLNSTNAYSSTAFWGNPTNSVFSFTSNSSGSILNAKHIAYCFAEVAGFSKFGSYTGNGLTGASGPSITTGFEPAFLMIKSYDYAYGWVMYDNKRDTTNPRTIILEANTSSGDLDLADIGIDFTLTGFQVVGDRGPINGSGLNFIYMAFANQF